MTLVAGVHGGRLLALATSGLCLAWGDARHQRSRWAAAGVGVRRALSVRSCIGGRAALAGSLRLLPAMAVGGYQHGRGGLRLTSVLAAGGRWSAMGVHYRYWRCAGADVVSVRPPFGVWVALAVDLDGEVMLMLAGGCRSPPALPAGWLLALLAGASLWRGGGGRRRCLRGASAGAG